MPWPSAITPVTLHGRIVAPGPAQTPAVGEVTFEMPFPLLDSADEVIVAPEPITVALTVTGEFTVVLPATDAPTISPAGWTYRVVVDTDIWRTAFDIEVPYDTIGVLELPPPAVTPPAVITFAVIGHTHAEYLPTATFAAKGDLAVGAVVPPAAAAPARLPVGADGYVLTADAAQPAGMKWAPAAAAGGFSGAWSGAIAYSNGAMATDSGWLLAAKTAHTNHPPYTSQQLDGSIPGTVDGGDGASHNMGVRFSSSRPLVLNAAGFFKSVLNVGTHVCTLFAVVPAGFPNAGATVIVAQKTYSGESASGWQNLTLDFLIWPGVNYTLATLMPNGHYAFTSGYFNNQITVGSLTFPVGAGVFAATSNPDVAPVASSGNAHYWNNLTWSEPNTADWAELARYPLLSDGPRFAVKAAL